MIIGITIACVFALLLNEIPGRRLKSVVQSASIFPFFVSWVIVYSIFNALFAVNSGMVNQLLVKMGILTKGINLLGDEKYSWALMIIANTWKGLGYNSVIFLAAIAGIDQQLYEAASIDGAGRFGKMRHITLPEIAGTFVILLIIHSGRVFTVNLEQYFMFTNQTNLPTMEVFDMYIYRFGLRMLDFSYATAVGMVKTFVSIVILLLVNGREPL